MNALCAAVCAILFPVFKSSCRFFCFVWLFLHVQLWWSHQKLSKSANRWCQTFIRTTVQEAQRHMRACLVAVWLVAIAVIRQMHFHYWYRKKDQTLKVLNSFSRVLLLVVVSSLSFSLFLFNTMPSIWTQTACRILNLKGKIWTAEKHASIERNKKKL